MLRQEENRLELDDNNLIRQAKFAVSVGNEDEAARKWEQARGLYPSYIRKSHETLAVLLGLRRFDEAERLMLEGQKLFSRDPYYFSGHAQTAQTRGDLSEAINRWAKFRRRFPREGMGFVQSAACLREAGSAHEAEALVNRSIKLLPQSIECRIEWAKIAEARHDWEEALRRWRWIQTNLGHVSGVVGAARSLTALGQLSDAVSILSAGEHEYGRDADFRAVSDWVQKEARQHPIASPIGQRAFSDTEVKASPEISAIAEPECDFILALSNLTKQNTNRITWAPDGWLVTGNTTAGTGMLTLGCPDRFSSFRVAFANISHMPYVVEQVVATTSDAWSDCYNPVGDAKWTVVTFPDLFDENVHLNNDIRISGLSPSNSLNEAGPIWTWSNWAGVDPSRLKPDGGMYVLMIRYRLPFPQSITYANGMFRSYSSSPDISHGFNYEIGGYKNHDLTTKPESVDVRRDLAQVNALVNGSIIAAVQFQTEHAGLVGLTTGDSHHQGTSTNSEFSNYLMRTTTELGSYFVEKIPFGMGSCAVWGAPSEQFFASLKSLLPDVRPSYVVLPGWSYNDLSGDEEEDKDRHVIFFNQLMDIALLCIQYESVPVFLTPFPRDKESMKPYIVAQWLALREGILHLRDFGAEVIDASDILGRRSGDALTGTYRSGLSTDGAHPNDAGHAALAETLSATLVRIFNLSDS